MGFTITVEPIFYLLDSTNFDKIMIIIIIEFLYSHFLVFDRR